MLSSSLFVLLCTAAPSRAAITQTPQTPVQAPVPAQQSDQNPPVVKTPLPPLNNPQVPPPPLQIVQVPKAGPILIPVSQAIQDLGKKPLTAEEAALVTLKLQPSVASAKASADSARAAFLESRASLLPTVNLSAGYDYAARFAHLGFGNVGNTNSEAAPSISSSVVLQQLLFDFGRTRDTVNQAKALADAAVTSLTKVQADLVYTTKSLFYSARSARELVGVAQADVKSRQDQLDIATATFKAGLGAPADVVTAETSLAQSTSNLVQSENNYVIALITLAATMGIDPRTPLNLADSSEQAIAIDPSKNDLQGFVGEALHHRPEILIAQQNLSAANFGLSSAKKGGVPSIGAFASVGASGAYDPFGTDTVTVGVTLNFPIYTGGLIPARVESANAGLASSIADLKSASITVISDVAQAYANLQAADQRVKIDAANVQSGQEAVRLAQGQYRAGVATFIQVTIAQAALVQAQGDLVSSQASLQTARAQFVRALGRPVPGVPPVKVNPKSPILPPDVKSLVPPKG